MSWEDILDRLRQTPHSRLPVYDGELDNLIGILHMKRVAQELARGTLTRERLMEISAGARTLLRARGHPADAAAGAVPAHAPAAGLRGQRIRRHRRAGDARGHPRGDRRRVHQRSGHGHAQGRAARRCRQLAGERQRDDPRAQSLARLAVAGRSGRARSMACCWRNSRPFPTPGTALRIGDYDFESCRSPTTHSHGAGARCPASPRVGPAARRPAGVSASAKAAASASARVDRIQRQPGRARRAAGSHAAG